MAFTASFLVKTVKGNQREEQIRVTADAASGVVDTGLGVVESLQHSPQSMATVAYRVFMNKDASLATDNGSVAISGVASGDVMFLTVLGR